jgi:hypothetical protein
MRTNFTLYEFAAILAPGAVVLFGASILFPGQIALGSLPDIDLGGLGLFVLLAYVVGHLTQAVGNALEAGYWKLWGGMPSEWVRRGELLSPRQSERLFQLVAPLVGSTESLDRDQWYAATREVNAAVGQAGRADRVNTFLGHYGLSRGIAAAGIVLCGMAAVFSGLGAWRTILVLFAGTAIAVFRMHRFGKHYARELFVQYLDLSTAPPRPKT